MISVLLSVPLINLGRHLRADAPLHVLDIGHISIIMRERRRVLDQQAALQVRVLNIGHPRQHLPAHRRVGESVVLRIRQTNPIAQSPMEPITNPAPCAGMASCAAWTSSRCTYVESSRLSIEDIDNE